jgi:ABC-type uncharacterized transport system ATPase subunit
MSPIISISALTKKYGSGLIALDAVDLTIGRGEIFALLGPNGAGKTTLIGVVCGIVSMTSGRVSVAGHDIAREYRAARSKVGLVPQEIALDIFFERLEDRALQSWPVWPAPRRWLPRTAAARPLAVGEARQPRRRTIRRNEKARDDRQGAQP